MPIVSRQHQWHRSEVVIGAVCPSSGHLASSRAPERMTFFRRGHRAVERRMLSALLPKRLPS